MFMMCQIDNIYGLRCVQLSTKTSVGWDHLTLKNSQFFLMFFELRCVDRMKTGLAGL